MKKFLVLALLATGVFSFSVKAADNDKITPTVEKSFNKEFAGATYVKWAVLEKSDMYQANFIYNNERLSAFFAEDGSLLAMGRFIASSNLPLLVTKTINNRFAGYEIKEVMEVVKGSETSYVVTVENEKTRLIVNAYSTGGAYIFKKEKKNS